MKKPRKSLLIVALGMVCLAGCHRTAKSASSMNIQCEVTPQPPHVGQVTFNLKLADWDTHAVTGAQIMLEGDMSHPGMPPVFGQARELRTGLYQGHLNVNMAGDWTILAHIRLSSGRMLEHTMQLRAVRPD